MTTPMDPPREVGFAEGVLRTRQDLPRLADLERLLGDFLVEEEIARTPCAAIYRIRAGGRIDQPLALKVALRPVEDQDLVRFQHEVRLLSEVRHPNVVEVYDFGVLPGGFPFLTMELLAGLAPARRIGEGDWESLYEVALQAAAGLAHIHRHGIVHLDVKPANLGWVAGEDGELRLKILDFGLAQSVRGPLDRRIRGTLAYVAPEVLLQDRYDHRADLYSLGMTLFQLATGVLPSAGTDAEAIRFHLEQETPDPLAYRADMPAPLAEILRRLLDRDPHGRFPSAGKLLLELAEAAGREIDPASMALGEGRVLASRMVGRADLLGRLREALADAAGGRPRVVLVEGPEGVGKSRLLRELRLLAAMQGARVGSGRAVASRAEPLPALRDALRALGIASEDGLREGGGDPAERLALFRRLGEQLAGAAADGVPVVVLLDDLQLAGEETRGWLDWAAAELGTARVLVVAARRLPAGEEDEVGAGGEDGGERLAVTPLDAAASRELVDASLGTAGLPQPLYDWVHEHAGGNPARIQQLLHHLVDERVLRFRQGEWKPSLPSLSRLARGLDEPQLLDRERVATLPVEELAMVEAAAVVAEPFHWHWLAELVGRSHEATYSSLATLQARGLLEALPEGEGGLHAFARPGLQRAVYDGLAPERRRELHRGWAAVLRRRLDQGEPELVSAVADHLWQGGERAESLPYLLRAAERFSAAFAHREAAELYGRAAEVARDLGDATHAAELQLVQAERLDAAGSTSRALALYRALLAAGGPRGRRAEDHQGQAELWLRVGQLYGKLGEAEEQLQAMTAGRELLAGLDRPALDVELLEGQAEALYRLGRLDEAFAGARDGLRTASRLGLDRQRAALLDILGRLLGQRGEWRKSRFLLRRGLTAALAVPDERLAARLRTDLGEVLWQRGDLEGARRQHRASLEAAERIRDPWTELTALHHLGVLECRRGNWKAAREPLTRSLELCRRLGARDGEAAALVRLAEVEELLGDWARAERHGERALKLLADAADHPHRVAALAQLASLARKRGNWGRAEDLARQALGAAERLGDRDLLVAGHQQLGLVEKDREHWAPAAAHLARAVELAEAGTGSEALARLHNSLADLLLRRGEPREAVRHLAEARRRAEQRQDRFELGKTLAGEARLALLDGDGRRGEELFAEAVRRLSELEVPFEYARALYEWGVRTPSPEIAVERLDRALVAFERLGAATDFERTRGVIEGIRERHLATGGGRAGPGLWEVAKVVNSTLDLQQVLDGTMDLVLERLGAERGMIVLAQPLTGELEVAVSRNLGSDDRDEGRKLSETVVRQVIDSREPVLAVDALTDPRFAGAESIVASHIVSILCVPLVIRDRLAGAIYVDHLRSQHLFATSDLDFLMAFADQAALAVDNARLYGELEAHRQKLKVENEALRREILSSRHLGSLIGRSRAIEHLKDTLERVAHGSSTVLVRGESGTGKGLVARILHSISPRREGPFIAFNCAALPETLVESELFGHEKGAFTGAVGLKPGRFELAHQGTIFLDEIGKVSQSVQAKLLRVVEEREFERVGGTRTLRSDVRVVAATNLDLEEAIVRGEFREDLYYRLNIIPIVLPPLRERREDIPYLVEHFRQKISRDLGQPAKEIVPEVLDLFHAYRWPGNVRELEAAVHRALVLSREEVLARADFAWIGGGELAPLGPPPASQAASATAPRLTAGAYPQVSSRFDRDLIVEALGQCDGKIRETARFLGIARNTLRAKMRRYGLEGR